MINVYTLNVLKFYFGLNKIINSTNSITCRYVAETNWWIYNEIKWLINIFLNHLFFEKFL
jgi:hypothetical protein